MTGDGGPGPLPRFVPRGLPRGAKRVYLAVTAFFVLVFVGLIWPVYPAFATIRPRVLGMPFSLVYVIIVLLAAFAVLLGLYVWEDRHGRHDPLDPETPDDDGPRAGHAPGPDSEES